MAIPKAEVMLPWLAYLQETVLLLSLQSRLLLSFTALFFLFLVRKSFQSPKSTKLPPSPPKFPFIGHLHRIGKFPHKSLHALSQIYGPAMLLYLSPTRTLVVSSVETAKQVLKTHDVIFANRPTMSAAKAFVYGDKDVGFAPYGDYWRHVRKIFITSMLTVKRRQYFQLIRKEEISNMLNKIKESCSLQGGRELTVNVSELISAFVNCFVPRTALGKSWGKNRQYPNLPREVAELFGTVGVGDVFPSLGWIDKITGFDRKMKKVSNAMHQFLDKAIEDHLSSTKDDIKTSDLVDCLLEHQKDAANGTGVELTTESIKALIFDYFVWGIVNLSTTTEWALTEVFNHPVVMKKLQTEIRQVTGSKPTVDEDDITHMNYLHCVIKETLRLHPPQALIMPRVSSVSTTIDCYDIPPKTQVYVNAWAILRDPEVWDKPEEFIPERFLDNPIDYKGQDIQFIPFGAGRRICPAVSFATISVESILTNLLYWFDWKLPDDTLGRTIDTTEDFGTITLKKSPICLVPCVRNF